MFGERSYVILFMATKYKSKNHQAMILANLNWKKLTFLRIFQFLFTMISTAWMAQSAKRQANRTWNIGLRPIRTVKTTFPFMVNGCIPTLKCWAVGVLVVFRLQQKVLLKNNCDINKQGIQTNRLTPVKDVSLVVDLWRAVDNNRRICCTLFCLLVVAFMKTVNSKMKVCLTKQCGIRFHLKLAKTR